MLGVILEVEPALVPPIVRASQRNGDIRVSLALLHSKVGAPNHHREVVVLQAGKLEEVLEEVLVGTNSQVPRAQRLKCDHLLDVF
jgi:hypothetical protein